MTTNYAEIFAHLYAAERWRLPAENMYSKIYFEIASYPAKEHYPTISCLYSMSSPMYNFTVRSSVSWIHSETTHEIIYNSELWAASVYTPF